MKQGMFLSPPQTAGGSLGTSHLAFREKGVIWGAQKTAGGSSVAAEDMSAAATEEISSAATEDISCVAKEAIPSVATEAIKQIRAKIILRPEAPNHPA